MTDHPDAARLKPMKIYQAFTPSGTEQADWSAGYFTGDHDAIREWVAENSLFWAKDQVRIMEINVRNVTMTNVETLRTKKAAAQQAQNELDALLKRQG